jgi:hypothetical protein
MKLAEADFYCLQCKISSKYLSDEQLYTFHSEIKQFYLQYASSYFGFDDSLAFTLTRQQAFNSKILNNNKKNKSMLRNEFDIIRNGGMKEEGKSWITRGHLINV